MKWIPIHANIDDHVIVAELNPNIKSPDKFIGDYISNLSRSSIESIKPLWDFHILNLKTSEAEGTGVFRCHHSLGDGISLMNLLLASAHKVSDPEALPTLPENNKLGVAKVASLWSTLGFLWNSCVAFFLLMCTAVFLEDTQTPMKRSKGVDHRTRRYVVRSVSLNDIKLVKRAMNVVIFSLFIK
ncbi:hypothetical protein L1987_77693 [Smallanthus sonchifolius]|uniref:Uncharacterized protein n=1 Tax=Smallanthus sonchifolius TaxID=185202 RepID=A0ACB8ZAU6_9ASTR|nr:hypothetical protein L1987_77693 [Smallanthus sonchifolius]